MRLIDAEALQKEDFTDFFIDDRDAKVFEDIIQRTPTIEAKPIVHAHVIEHQGYEDEYYCECSNCHTHEVWVECKYCSECGAQMDGTDTNVGSKTVKIPVISMEDVPKIMEEMEK